MEKLKPRKYPRQMRAELLLGDIHTNYRERENHIPTSFQLPLIKQVKGEMVSINRHSYVIKSGAGFPSSTFTNNKTPPHLIEKPHLPPYIYGEWTSTRCEVRPLGLYLTRRFSFYSEDSTWIGEHKFYSDPFCKIPKFIVTAAGHFTLTVPNKELKVQYDIVKLEMDYKGSCLLFLGQVHTDSMQNNQPERPTSFQLPLVKCGEVASYSQSLREILDDGVYYGSSVQFKACLSLHLSFGIMKVTNISGIPQYNNAARDMNRVVAMESPDISCLGALKWAFNELRLLKIQLRPIMKKLKPRKYPRQIRAELLLGDINTNYRERENHIPTSFQLPLIKQVKGEMVSINRHSYVIKSGAGFPSSTFTNNKTPPHLIEKPHLPPYIYGEWTSTRCEVRPLGLYLTRRFSFYSEDSTWIGEHKFYSDPFCKIPKFIVTAAGHFTLTVPNKELKVQYDIVKLEMDYKGSCLLFLGQVNTDSMQNNQPERPTSFQLPLVKCGEVASYSQSLREILDDGVYYEQLPKLDIKLGKIRGYVRTSYNDRQFAAFEGIPYAKPPIGNLRFKDPEPAEPWNGIWDATVNHHCIQYSGTMGTGVKGKKSKTI
ncbi:unnamed protein product [Brassicogethes aeneus]|uniref:APCDD1 domain-containing protein n=1 Tax=Brassicogethes aeneus TaxID=1431903 RepID=A0A9P0FAE1_BRAAE|nr:unnamed protein product [Brassicogethes aeneus]